ncbi:MAG: hypothetical protein GXP62_03585 [Oligoflexia bacterium]|nr:hypothetical protein [Oligoflexia bacterium]
MSEQPTVTAEGATLGEALTLAAAELGVPLAQVLHKLDAEHFRNQYGAMTGANTVKIFAWVRDPAEYASGQAARDYIAELVEKMGFQASVRFRIRPGNNADVRIDSESARFLVGKQGHTLNAIRQLLAENVGRKFPDWTYHLDVVGGERDRADAGDRGRDRDRDRDPKPGSRSRSRSRSGPGPGPGSGRPWWPKPGTLGSRCGSPQAAGPQGRAAGEGDRRDRGDPQAAEQL